MNSPGCGGQMMEMGETDEQMQAQELRQGHHFLEEEQRGRAGRKCPRGAGSAQEGQEPDHLTVWAMVRKSDFIPHCVEITGKY